MFLIIFRFILLRMRNVSETIVNKIEIRILRSVTLFRKSCRLLSKEENYSTAGQTTDDKMEYGHFTLLNWGYKNTLNEYVIL